MQKLITNIFYSLIGIVAVVFALQAPSFTQKAVAGATPQLFAQGTELRGFVVGVMDGDTLKLHTDDRRELRIRLSEIAAPKKGQAYGDVAKRSLSDLAFNKPATVRVVETDRYGCIVGRVSVGTLDVNMAQVGRGMAWAYVQYVTDPRITALEGKVRSARVGLWSAKEEPVAPWLFRTE
jgi:endonuclease YncB( thermonuclease family)